MFIENTNPDRVSQGTSDRLTVSSRLARSAYGITIEYDRSLKQFILSYFQQGLKVDALQIGKESDRLINYDVLKFESIIATTSKETDLEGRALIEFNYSVLSRLPVAVDPNKIVSMINRLINRNDFTEQIQDFKPDQSVLWLQDGRIIRGSAADRAIQRGKLEYSGSVITHHWQPQSKLPWKQYRQSKQAKRSKSQSIPTPTRSKSSKPSRTGVSFR